MKRLFPSVVATLVLCGVLVAQEHPPRVEFTRMIAHWAQYGGDDYLDFVRDAEPEVVQLGFYGAHFWSLVQTPQFDGYPAHFPVRGWEACGDWFEKRNRAVHAINPSIKVIGHFNIEFLVGDPDSENGPRGFFQWYRDGWNEALLGKRPYEDPQELLERDGKGMPYKDRGYAIGGMSEYRACLRNPGWQQILKGWVKQGIQRGLDGFMINYFYRRNCLCPHCVDAFKAYLTERFTATDLRERFKITDLKKHAFKEIVSWHDPAESTVLRREMLRFSQISNKDVFDKVFVRYGRSLKPNLIVGQWNHLGDFSQVSGDERCLLPTNLWGKGEDYLWYSTGGAANATDLAAGFLGEGTLQARYIRGAFDDKPFTLGKYENTRIRLAIAELAANGGTPMGFYTRFTDAAAREEIVRYYQFLEKHDAVYRANRPFAEVALLYPRQSVHEGKIDAVARFKTLGKALLDAHVLFEVFPDDQAASARKRYATVLDNETALDRIEGLIVKQRIQVNAPSTTRVSASRPANSNGDLLDLHFVNYNRIEPPKNAQGHPSPGGGIHEEKPLPVSGIRVEILKPFEKAAFLTPEAHHARELELKRDGKKVVLTLPEFLVYAVVRLQ